MKMGEYMKFELFAIFPLKLLTENITLGFAETQHWVVLFWKNMQMFWAIRLDPSVVLVK